MGGVSWVSHVGSIFIMACAVISFAGVWWNIDDTEFIHIVGDDALDTQWAYGAMVSSAVALAFSVLSVCLSFAADFGDTKELFYATAVSHAGTAAAATAAFGMVVSHTWDLRDLFPNTHFGFSWGFAFEIITAGLAIIFIFISAAAAHAESKPRRNSHLDKNQWHNDAPQNQA
ncbi:Hypothetical Protein FCC1311_107362 [Hondaea fermentalgiana]|uniref:Uncharacterized protein n=1 Tax=Hondaea fermentalgiana TaxID=2315210 RepID=A0A2R5GUI2_9STRA|nr:Hypothetical Protein FCC1311_107362 [Hondaea fermentalgiana]|eukprot:GBG34512.1 Hypothetical Protein FCC1311_107362 [Hondaea fermentalgiana]